MSIGYSKIISKHTDTSFIGWVNFLNEEFTIFYDDADKLCVIDQNGDRSFMLLSQAESMHKENGIIILRVFNKSKNHINCTFELTNDKVYCLEEYTLEELLSEEEYDALFYTLSKRYMFLYERKLSIGTIFDSEGYSEDYFLWKNTGSW